MKDQKVIIAKKLEELDLGLSYDEIYDLIEIPPQDDMGDYSFPCFSLAKIKRQNPAQIASELKDQIGELETFEKVETLNAYINFYSDKAFIQNQVLNEVLKEKENYGKKQIGTGKNVTIDFSAPNIAKPFHIGHIRSTVIGDAIRNIYKALGYNTIGINYIGDYGTQFGVMIAAYKLWGDKKAIDADPINELLKLYVRYNTEAEDDPKMMDAARQEFRNLEEGQEEAVELWQWFKDLSLKEFDRVYAMLDIEFDNYHGESYNAAAEPRVISELKEKNLLVDSEGAQIIDLTDEDLPPAIILKSNGSSAYITRDIATAENRDIEYGYYKNLYVVASQQNLHFQQLRKILKKMGHDYWEDCIHIPFGLVSMKDKTLSTRRGHVIFLEDVLNKAIEKTKEIMADRDADIENIDETAQIVGIGAVKFQELYNNRIKDYVFNWDNLLNFNGETGPYVQYTYARAKSVLAKAGKEEFAELDFKNLNTPEEMALIKSIAGFEDSLIKAHDKYEPSIVSRQIMEIAKNFNKFYNAHQIMVEDEDVKNERLALTYAASIVIKEGLALLGIKTVEKM
ncbi:arginine--tRNA ligase [Anaerococcus sp. Marseille-Q7828]|uniref:arginine--tRNA ligase n=1 Tax=Anaerococcus sp. Marseille-Q7828 TaxID=3036300 RepID=UPI0024ADFFD8|nr:arginine--tRNA ligase [Anaerococcus sp. Marseille-Q7828]